MNKLQHIKGNERYNKNTTICKLDIYWKIFSVINTYDKNINNE